MNGAVIAIAAKTRKYRRVFKNANATSPETSILPEEYGIRKSLIFNKMVREGVLVALNKERYYLNERRDNEVRKKRQTIVLIFLAFLLIAAILSFLISKK